MRIYIRLYIRKEKGTGDKRTIINLQSKENNTTFLDIIIKTAEGLKQYEPRMHCEKKVNDFLAPSRNVTNQTLPGREKFNYSRPGSLVIDIQAGDRKIVKLFLQCKKLVLFHPILDTGVVAQVLLIGRDRDSFNLFRQTASQENSSSDTGSPGSGAGSFSQKYGSGT
jgi:hypothetical protein